MFNDKKPSKYLICKNYEEALAKINTLHLEKNQLNVVYYKNGDKVDALLGIPGYKKDAQNIVFNSAANDNVINFSDIENQVKEIIRRNASSSTTYASEINKKLTQHTEDASVKFDEIDTSISDLSTNIYSELEATREFWNDKYDDTVNIFKHDINFTNVSTYKVSLSLSRLYRLLGISETEQSSAGESIIQQLADVKQQLQELNDTYNQQIPIIKRDVSTLKLDVSQNTFDISTLQKDNTINKLDISINKADISALKELTASHTRNLAELSGNLDSLFEMLSKTIGDVNADALRQISELNGKVTVINNDISAFENDFSIYQEATDASILALKNRLNNDISTKIDEIIQDVYDLSTNIYDELDRIHQNIYDVSTNVSNLDHLIDFTIYDNTEGDDTEENNEDNNINDNTEENNG